MPGGFSTPTFSNNPVAVTYVGNGVQFALNLPFAPTACRFWGATLSWEWCRGMSFGDAKVATGTYSIGTQPETGGVLDVLDGSGIASTNVGTTTQVIGLLIGTNTTVNNGGGVQYRGLIYR